MAMCSNKDNQGFSVGASPGYRTVRYTLKEALQAVLLGEMDWRNCLTQLPDEMREDLVQRLPRELGAHFHAAGAIGGVRIPLVLPRETVQDVFGHFLETVEAMEHQKPEQISLKDALGLVAAGRMDPDHLFTQFSSDLKSNIDDMCRQEYGGAFATLAVDRKKAALARLADSFDRPEPTKPTGHTLLEAMQWVVDGKMDPMHLHAQLPPQIRDILDNASRAAQSKPFTGIPADEQRVIIAAMMAAAARNAGG